MLSCPIKNPKACFTVKEPLTKGRSEVLKTFWSISLSQRSLIVHPAPRIINEPTPNRDNKYRSGQHPGAAAIAILQLPGQNNNQEPEKYFIRHIK